MASNESAAGRFLLTLACLVIIPLAAVFGTWLPDLVRQLSQARWGIPPAVARDLFGPAANTAGLSEAPPWNQAGGSLVATSMRDPSTGLRTAAAGIGIAGESSDRMVSGPGTSHRAIGPLPGGGSSPGTTPQVPPLEVSAVSNGNSAPSSFPDTDLGTSPHQQAGGAAMQPNGPDTSSDLFVAIQSRLQQLGAVYYLLETWGSDPPCYRFYARMAVGGNRNVTRHFEAVDHIPLRAMQRVLEQVERWKAAEQ